jgi:hypothetical protein
MFIQSAVSNGGVTQTANANRDGTGTLATIITCNNPAGLRIDSLRFQATDTTVANILRVYLCKGSDKRLIKEIQVTAATPSNTVMAWSFDWMPDPALILADGYSLEFAPSTGTARYHASVTSGGVL